MFLLFLIGIEMSVERLWSLRRFVAGIGSVQFLLSAAAFGMALSLIGASSSAAIILGLGLAMSSSAVVMQLLEEQGRTATPLGQVAIAVLLFQDLMVAPVLFGAEYPRPRRQCRVGPWLGGADGGGRDCRDPGRRAIPAAAAVQRCRADRQPRTDHGDDALDGDQRRRATGYVGLDRARRLPRRRDAVGTEYRHQVEIDIAPFKGLLVGLFFITVGMTIDVRMVWDGIGTILLAVALLLAIKAFVLYAACRLFGVARA